MAVGFPVIIPEFSDITLAKIELSEDGSVIKGLSLNEKISNIKNIAQAIFPCNVKLVQKGFKITGAFVKRLFTPCISCMDCLEKMSNDVHYSTQCGGSNWGNKTPGEKQYIIDNYS